VHFTTRLPPEHLQFTPLVYVSLVIATTPF
jgi:hypothetical protein